MPRIIRQALGERLRREPAVQTLLENFRAATGVSLEFVGPLGHRDPAWDNGAPLCARLRTDPAGCRLCTHFHQSLLESARDLPATRVCDAGLCESAVPLRAGSNTLGYLVASGYTAAPPGTAQFNRARHLLGCGGVVLDAPELAELLQATPIVSPHRQRALVQLLQALAAQLSASLGSRLAAPEIELPPLVESARRLVEQLYGERLAVPALAKRLQVSEGHLSRTFHRATGLRLVEYIARVRAERAHTLLRETHQPVTEIAFACGFQSLSQFNRTFRTQFGQSPTQARQRARSPAG